MIIATSKVLEYKDIDERLKEESFVMSICNDYVKTKRGNLYLIKSGKYKLECYFSSDGSFNYFMVEKYEKRNIENEYLTFCDDAAIFSDKDFVKNYFHENIEEGCVKSGNLEFHISDGVVDSLYVLQSESKECKTEYNPDYQRDK